MASPTVRSTTRTSGATAASVVVTKPTGTVDGDIVLIGLYKENTAAVTLSGFTLEATAVVTGTQTFNLYLFSKRASGEGASWTASWTGSVFVIAGCLAIQNAVASGTYQDGTADAQIRTTTTVRTFPDTSLTTATADTILVWFGGSWAGVGTGHLTVPTGFTVSLDGAASSPDLLAATKAAAATGAQSVTGAAWATDATSSAASVLMGVASVSAGGAAGQPTARRFGLADRAAQTQFGREGQRLMRAFGRAARGRRAA